MSDVISIRLPDGSSRELPAGATTGDLAESIGSRLAKAAVAANVDGHEVDLDTPLRDGAEVAIITNNTPEGRHVLRHSTAHVMAQAVTQLWPGAKFAIGPPIEDGFYYDFELPDGATFNADDLERIEARMREIVDADQAFVREEHSIDEGIALFADQPYKREIIEGVDASEGASGDGVVTAYRNSGDFVDLCRGPHVPSTKRIGSFKLTKVAAAYWRGDEKRQQLQRIYGTAWEDDKALKAHLTMLEEAEKRDHRKLGVELDLFSFPSEIGSGLPVFHPKGGTIRRLMEDYSRRRHEAAGYEFVNTPHISKSTLFETSGHLQWFADGMYPPMEMEGATYYAKPMNCPMHTLIFRSRGRSYRELPLRLFEFGSVYRFEKSGVVHGLTRVRGMTMDDAHIYCTRDQMAGELESLLTFVLGLLRDYGLDDFYLELSTRPEGKAVGTDKEWEEATETLRRSASGMGLELVMDEGGGAFYGPKISVQAKDAIGRTWQMSTIQLDFQTPKRFGIEFNAADGTRQEPIMIHRALFGSVERFFGVLTEHYAGAFPAWLAPVQVRVLGVRNDHDDHAAKLVAQLKAEGFRVDVVEADEPLGARIRKGKLEKLPYILVVGDDDVADGTVGVNVRGSDRPERGVSVDDFIERLRHEAVPPDFATA
ncbi:MAG TPA: threonine--tRNA ligase [Acidimicrobiales bacterium]|nr:threonine--tRNA ligase [Acidimicrobiales bacterium]